MYVCVYVNAGSTNLGPFSRLLSSVLRGRLGDAVPLVDQVGEHGLEPVRDAFHLGLPFRSERAGLTHSHVFDVPDTDQCQVMGA